MYPKGVNYYILESFETDLNCGLFIFRPEVEGGALYKARDPQGSTTARDAARRSERNGNGRRPQSRYHRYQRYVTSVTFTSCNVCNTL